MALPEALQQLLPTLPKEIVIHILRLGVCLRCTFRFLNVRSPVYSISLPCPHTILAGLSSENGHNPTETHHIEEGDSNIGSPEESTPCLICLGVLQYLDHGQGEESHKGVQVYGDSSAAGRHAVSSVLAASRQGGYMFDTFCLEVSLPALILVRERALWCYLRDKYKEEPMLSASDVNSQIVSLKEAVKWSLIERLEHTLPAKFDSSSTFRIALVYKHPGSPADIDFLSASTGGDTKRRRYGQNDPNSHAGFAAVVATRAAAEAGESLGSVQRALSSMSNDSFMRRYVCPPSKVDIPCDLTAMCWRSSVYVGGRYLKLSRNISQSRWLIDDERMGEGSVQEIIGDVVLPYHKADSYKFHAAGREDIDVRMLGSGRPFIIEVVNAHMIPSESDMSKAEEEINSRKEGWSR